MMVVIPKPEKTYYHSEGLMDSYFFKNYLEEKCSKGILQRIKKYWTTMDDEEDDQGLEYKVFGIENTNDRETEYTEFWLLDNEGGYIPIFVTGINTSSCYAMVRSGMDREIEDGDDVKTQYTLDEICDLLIPQISKASVCGIIEKMGLPPKNAGVIYFNPSN
jgi:hypothetical protein